MAFHRAIRILLAGAAALVLASCGGGSSVVSDFHPTRLVVFGDAMADLKLGASPSGSGRYTVNGDNTVNNWVLQLASYYSLTPASANVKAEAHARVATSTDAAGGSATTVRAQVTSFLGASTLSANDLVVVSAGTSDLISEGYSAITANTTAAENTAASNVRQAARDLATDIRRLVSNGARRVLVLSPYNLGKTPWATAVSKTTLLENLSREFYDELVVQIADLNENVLVVDARLQMNSLVASTSYNATTLACTTATTGSAQGIGTGLLQVDSSLCSAAVSGNLAGSYNASTFLFADRVYPTPLAHRSLGDYARDKLRTRW